MALTTFSSLEPRHAGLFALRHWRTAWKSGTGCSMLRNRKSLGKKASTIITRGRKFNEASRLYQGHRHRRRRSGQYCRSGHRPVDAGAELAHDDELAEIARYAARR